MKTILYYVHIDNKDWIDVVVEDFRWICTSGLFKDCGKMIINVLNVKTNNLISGEEWVTFFWGRVDDTKKVEIHLIDEPLNMKKWIASYPDVIYANTNLNS